MSIEELDALVWPAVVVDKDGDVWSKALGEPGWDLVGEVTPGSPASSRSVAEYAPLVPLIPATDSGAERLAALRKAVLG